MSASAPATGDVHWTQTRLRAATETDGHGDSCGPIVILDYLALLDPQKWPLNNVAIDTIRAFAVQDGDMNNPAWGRGMTITSIAHQLTSRYHIQPVKVSPYVDPARFNFDAFRTDLIAALQAHQLVIMETSRGYALPGNQSGVEFHFILIGGIDSSAGYYTCNGDTYAALGTPNGAVGPVWYTRTNLQASMPCGYLILPAIPVPASPDVKGALADLASMAASLSSASSAAGDAIKKLEQ